MEIPVDEILGAISLQYPDLHRFEDAALQWIYEAESVMSEGQGGGLQKIGWTWTNDGSWTDTFIALPNDVVDISTDSESVIVNGMLMIEQSDNYKKRLQSNEYYKEGPYLHFSIVPNEVRAKVIRIKTNADGRFVVDENNALGIRYYVLWKITETEMLLENNVQLYRMKQEKAELMKRQYLVERRNARGTANNQSEEQIILANIEWHNMYENIKRTW